MDDAGFLFFFHKFFLFSLDVQREGGVHTAEQILGREGEEETAEIPHSLFLFFF